MANPTLTYKGFLGEYSVNPEMGTVFGRVQGIRDVVTFQASNLEGAERAFQDSVDDYLEMLSGEGVTYPFTLRR